MNIPNWADENLSKELPVLRSRGEGQNLEFKEIFPQNTRDLAKEVAAFATSNQGTILIGVSDSGDLVGIKDAENQEERDNLLKRLEGICRGTVKPAITPVAKFAIENELVVLAVNVPHGRQPIYYSNNIPYVRHLTEARPAEPHEVLELIAEYLASQRLGENETGPDDRSVFYSNLARILVEVLIYAEQADEREINPWIDQWRSEFGYAAAELRDLSAQDIAIEEKIADELKEVSSALDAVASMRLTIGCGPQLKQLTEQAREKVIAIKQREIDSIQLSAESVKQIRNTITMTTRKLNGLVNRSHDMVETGRIEELQTEASEFGHQLLRICQYNIDSLKGGMKENLTSIGRELHLVETMRLYMDGGKSLQAMLDKISDCNNSLSELADEL
ncbi:MAG: ATP-binding protein [Proteobacteria bacterium]|nr:ATP-binding protein [Pseudomonadota bacterium]MBU1582006.1 ATP-binding protein [Pseudomonadota bacterium]MBU2455782.1 ATP-binding protein [Pseudomonadota bacterium]MBU2628380.1 ATP-binding protein [Pseudomonadota bacterium]